MMLWNCSEPARCPPTHACQWAHGSALHRLHSTRLELARGQAVPEHAWSAAASAKLHLVCTPAGLAVHWPEQSGRLLLLALSDLQAWAGGDHAWQVRQDFSPMKRFVLHFGQADMPKYLQAYILMSIRRMAGALCHSNAPSRGQEQEP